VPLAETFEAFGELKRTGKIGGFGVSNFDTPDMEEAWKVAGGRDIAVNQILYNLTRRNVEFDLLPWCREHGVPVMAYSPVEQGRLARNKKLEEIAKKRGVTAAQVALAWLLAQEGIIAIPKASSTKHVEENRGAADLVLSDQEIAALDREFPRPAKRTPLEML
jgi:diketogulonate reductase-like aldo/keto reductase